MMPSTPLISLHDMTIDIGGMPVLVHTDSLEFAHMLEDRYGKFAIAEGPRAVTELDIELVPPGKVCDAEDVCVRRDAGRWVMERGDFRAEWDPQCHRGWVRQSANPYAIDGVLRILHSLILAREGGFLVHAASAVRNGRAFVFAGVSGAGKTTLARLAPPDVTLLTDEISYVRDTGDGPRETGTESEVRGPRSGVRSPESKSQIANRQSTIENFASSEPRVPCPVSRIPVFQAFGTPFAGELARIGQNVRAPLATLFLLKQGSENRIEPLSEGQAARELLRHVLFFARDEELVGMIFQTVCDFVRRVPVCRLVFTPDARVWELIA
jgi:ABC-type molybdenum transport system ATPase subunit/photorepair protein PhrA